MSEGPISGGGEERESPLITERKQAEEALREAEVRYRTVADNTYDWEFWLDPGGRFIYCSPSCERITGHKADEFLADPDLRRNLIHPDDRPEFEKHAQEIERKPAAGRGQWRFLRIDGTWCWVEHVCQPVYGDHGEFLGTRGSNRNITDRKRAEEALFQLARFPAENPNPVLRISADGALLYANAPARAWLKALGWVEGGSMPSAVRQLADNATRQHKEKQSEIVDGQGRVYWLSAVSPKGENYITIYGRDITERKQAEETLRQAHTYLNHVLQGISDAFYALDREWRFTYMNQQAAKLNGRQPEEVLGKTIWEVFPEIIGTPLEEAYRKVMEEGVPVRRENLSSVVKDHWFEVDIHPIEDGITIFGRDITDRKKYENALHDTSQYLENLINYANAPIIVWDNQFRITRFNHASERLTGRSAEEVMGKNLEILFPAETVEGSMDHIRRAMAGERWEVVEIPILHKDGGIRTVLWNSATLYEADRKTVSSAIAQGQDITERKQAEEELYHTSQYLENLINYANAPIIVWDNQFRITRFNHASERLTGRSAEEVMGKNLEILFPAETVEGSMDHIRRAMAGERWEVVEIPILNKDGETRTVFWNSATLYEADGVTVSSAIAQGQDITERKRAEQETQRLLSAVQEEKDRLSALINSISDEVWFADTEKRFTLTNPSAVQEFGIGSNGDIDVEKFAASLEVYYPDGRSRPVEEAPPLRALLGETIRNQVEIVRTPATGEMRYRQVSSSPVRDARGTIIGSVSVVSDVTERKRAEEAVLYAKRQVEEALEILRALYDNAPIGFAFVDPEFRYIHINDTFAGMNGIPAKDHIGHTFESIVPWLWPSVVSTFKEVLRTGVPASDIELSGELPSAPGVKKYWLENVYRVQSPDGQVIGIGVTLADITSRKRMEDEIRQKATQLEEAGIELSSVVVQRKKAEEAVRKTLSILHAALESTADAMLVIDRTGRITSYNQNFTTMWNIPDSVLNTLDTRAATGFVSVQLRDPDAFLARIEEISNHPSRESYDMFELLDGRIIERYSKPQKIGNVIVGRVYSYRDVTERKRAELQLIESLNEKEVLLREIHHRVKNNLQLTTSLLDMTRMRTQDPGTSSVLTDVMMKIQTMAQIHTRLYESKQFDRINMGGQIRDQIRALSNIYSSGDREITTEIDSPDLYLPLDQAIPCALALNEILSNAYKHAFRGRKGGTVKFSAGEKDGRIRFTVSDNGIGLPEGFDLTKANTLGLKLVRTLIEQQLKGTLEMKRKKGTEVIVELPIKQEEEHV